MWPWLALVASVLGLAGWGFAAWLARDRARAHERVGSLEMRLRSLGDENEGLREALERIRQSGGSVSDLRERARRVLDEGPDAA